MSRPAFFLDRDGVINKDKKYVYKVSDFEWIEGAKESIKLLNTLGYYVFVITNQSGIGRGFYSELDVIHLHRHINQELGIINAKIDDFFYSPYHHLDKSGKFKHLKHLRKPNVGMLEMACSKWDIDKKKSLMIGDSDNDLICAKNFGIRGFLFRENNLLNFIKKLL
jgi:D-glycero-D-manno-heptose 1,7-bisphosphate phosphatase